MRVRFWRFFLALSLLLILPMQGYAAARMASCDTVLAQALAGGARSVADGSPLGAHHAIEKSVHDGAVEEAHVTAHEAVHATAHEAVHEGEGSHQAVHDVAQNPAHSAHGTSCMTCTPCSPGAALACVVPVAAALVSVRTLPAILAAPASADLALPERPPQHLLA